MTRGWARRTATCSAAVLVALLAWSTVLFGQGTAPEIIFVGFPTEITANGMPCYGYLSFKDQEGDIAQIRMEIVAGSAGELQITPGWVFDPGIGGKTSGTVEFTVAAVSAGSFTLRVTL